LLAVESWLERRTIVAPLLLLPVLLVFLALAGCKEEKPPAPPPTLPEVVVQQVQVRDVPVEVEETGAMRGGEDVDIRARVAGFLLSINYREGTVIRKGQLMFVIDPKPFQAIVSRDRAQLQQAKALHERAVVQVNRLRPLVGQNAVAQADLDNAIASEESSRSSMAAAQAQLTSSELDLSYTRVRSPITGLAGQRLQDVGSYVGSPDPTVLAVVSSLDPVRFSFNVAETDYLTFARTAKARGTTILQMATGLELVLADGTVHPYKGRLTVVGRAVSTATGTLPFEATFPNPAGLLRPGQFGRLTLQIATIRRAIVIPQRAVQELQGTYNVYVVGPDSIARVRAIEVGIRIDSSWVASAGLTPTDRIVVEGLQKVKANSKVRPVAAAPVAPVASPTK